MNSPFRIAGAIILIALGFAVGAYWTRGASTISTVSPAAHEQPDQLWTCGMHPQVIQDQPGFCPICGMALTPLKPAAPRTQSDMAAGASVTVDPVVVQNIGVRVAAVEEGPLHATIRAVGYLEEAQPNQHDVNLRVSGWIQHLYADTEGMHVHAGAPLFDLYSPELQVAVEELIAARRASDRAVSSAVGASSGIYAAAVRKLTLLGVRDAQIQRLAQREQAPPALTFTSPISGHLVEKMIVDGSAVKAGDRILRIVDHSTLWLDAQVYEQHLAAVRLGQTVTASVAAMPGERVTGEIIFIHPHVAAMTRAAMVRIALANPSLALRPNL
jgi:Cu(I)/Ag(I) efflux system membrane fusion protein